MNNRVPFIGPHHLPKFWFKKPKATTKVTLTSQQKWQNGRNLNLNPTFDSRWRKSIQFCLIEHIVQWWPMGKYILEHKLITNTAESKIIQHNYILYQGEPNYVGNIAVYLGMPLIFTDFQQCTQLRPTSFWKN